MGFGAKAPQVFNEINITPLTDIFLVLLIIMMVVAPMVQQMRADINVPKIQAGNNVEPGKLTVEVTKEGQFYVTGAETPEAQLGETLKAKMPTEKDETGHKTVVIRADRETRSRAVMQVLQAARSAGFEKVTVAGESLEQTRQDELRRQNEPTAGS
jgi:biopolymer transport protein ExbD/biopolymer transport protein TolR